MGGGKMRVLSAERRKGPEQIIASHAQTNTVGMGSLPYEVSAILIGNKVVHMHKAMCIAALKTLRAALPIARSTFWFGKQRMGRSQRGM